MGQEIVYCCRCQTRLVTPDFDRRKAFRVQSKPCCLPCLEPLLESLPPDERAHARADLARSADPKADPSHAPSRKTSTAHIPIVSNPRPEPPGSGSSKGTTHRMPAVSGRQHEPPRSRSQKTTTARLPIIRPDTPRSGTSRTGTGRFTEPDRPGPRRSVQSSTTLPWAIFGSIGLLVLVVIAAAVFSGGGQGRSSERPEPRAWKEPSGVTIPEAEPIRPPVSRLEEKAARSLAEARDMVKAHPDDLLGALAVYERLTWECRGTSLLPDAQKEYQAVQSKVADGISRELAPVLDEVRAARKREDFPRMLAILAEARTRHPWPDWTAALDRETREVGLEEDRLFAQLRFQAEEAKSRRDEGRTQAILDRISRWGSPELAETLKTALAAIKPPPVVSPDAGRYRDRWEAALTWMASRSMADALQELERARKEVTNAELGKEADEDLALAHAASSLLAAAAENLQKSPKGRTLSLLLEAGEKVDGSFERALPAGIELKKEADTLAVDLPEVTARSLVSYVSPSDESGRRAAALLLLLDGDSSPDQGLLPAKYGEFLPRLGRLFPAQAEDDARTAYAQAEREFLDPSGRALSLERYRTLSEQFAKTRFVLRRRAPIASRMAQAKEAGRDYLLLAWDLSGAGAFQLVPQKKGETAWTMLSDAQILNANFVDFSFVAVPGQDYKGWVLLGGCCQETFSYSIQGTELVAPLPERPGERGAAEPGTTLLLPGKPPQVFLKRLHSQHGGGPKAPARWEWVALPLPKYASGGRKTIRLLSTQQGFSVRAALITVVRETPPGDTELRELERTRQHAPGGTSTARDTSLVGHWKLDDAKGTVAADASGNGLAGTLRNEPAWSGGRKAGALSFNGINQYVELGNAPRFALTGPFTIAAWVNPAAVGAKNRYILADYVEKGDQSSFALSIEASGQASFFWENPSGIEPKALSRSILKAGSWVHVAGVWDGSTRKVLVNGVLEGSESTAQPRPSGVSMVSIGRPGAFNGLYFSGDIEDVRLYSRALSDAELSVLARGGKAR